ncbi:hypothetical protein N9M20_01385 [Gammaproteobacteria bacterium]|nr:hypothetical protein [Gammaproteobacteria bacterium]
MARAPKMHIARSTKKTLNNFFQESWVGIELVDSSNLKISIAATLNQLNTTRNVMAPQTNSAELGLILYDLLYLF